MTKLISTAVARMLPLVLADHARPVGGNVGFDGVVHEYFTIHADGGIIREVREGTPKLDDWHDPHNRTMQKLELTPTRVTEKSRTTANLSRTPAEAMEGSPVIDEVVREPAAWWRFDDGLTTRDWERKDLTIESIGGRDCSIGGHKSVWKQGVSGTCLAFDGYYSKVTVPAENAPRLSDRFTIEAWIAPGAYSICAWSAIVHQSRWEPVIENPLIFDEGNWGAMQVNEHLTGGYFLGIDETGHLGFLMKAGNQVWQVISSSAPGLYEWSHVAATFGNGELRLYLNGVLAGAARVAGRGKWPGRRT